MRQTAIIKCTHATNDTYFDDVEINIPTKEIAQAKKVMIKLGKLPECVRWVAFKSNADIYVEGVLRCTDLSTLNFWTDGSIFIECDLDGITYEGQVAI